jgi:hypothetical protein
LPYIQTFNKKIVEEMKVKRPFEEKKKEEAEALRSSLIGLRN